MSHVAAISLHIKSLLALKRGAKAIGMELIKQPQFKWYGTHVGDYPLPAGFTKEDMGKCEYALRIPGNKNAYEVGVVKRRDGKPGYQLLWDFWSRGYGLQDAIGDSGEKLKQSYAVELAKEQVESFQTEGFRLETVKCANGDIELKVKRG